MRLAAAYLNKAEANGSRRHILRARRGLAKAREQLVLEAAGFGRQLRDALAEQQALLRQSSGGAINPVQINEQNRALTARLNALRQMIADANALLTSSGEQTAQGAPDLPLDEYYWRVRSLPMEAWMPTRRGFITWLAAMGAVGIGGAAYVGVQRGTGRISMSVRAVQPTGPFIIEIRNESSKPLPLLVPRGDVGVTQEYGLSFMAAEKGSSEFRRIDCLDCWSWRGAPLVEPHQFKLEPQLPVQIEFRPGPLRAINVRPERFQFTLTAPKGSVVAEQRVQIQ